MTELKLTMACWDYDRTRALIDGRVKPKGINLNIRVMRPREAFTRMLEREEFDIAEVSLANYAALRARGDERFAAIPVAMSKIFRHSCIYVRADANIEKPADLRGRRVGVPQIDSTGIVFIKGFLRHDYGVMQDELKWVVGGLEKPAPPPRSVAAGHGNVDVAAADSTLVGMLADGRIDALFSNHIPSSFDARAPHIKRLFPDFKAEEQGYFRRTGIFPVMHVIALKTSLLRSDPAIPQALFAAFVKARDAAIAGLHDTDALRLTLPWLIDHVEEAWRVLGYDYWSYGLEPNRKTWATIGQLLVEQSLAPRVVTPEELFVPV